MPAAKRTTVNAANGCHCWLAQQCFIKPLPCGPRREKRSLLAVLALLSFHSLSSGTLADDLVDREEAAIKAAVARVAPSVVRVETLGGLEQTEGVLFGDAPTSGLVVSADGHIITSSFQFARKPSRILVLLADGSRRAAKIVATDHTRLVTLLSVDAQGAKLTAPDSVPRAEMKVGQWSLAVGRTFDGPDVNVSAGIVSALDRIWDKAIQTDAKISPQNYGGPLIDIRGRVFGVLTPFSPEGDDAVAGSEWYDSGIGFAVPLEHVLAVLPRLQKGEDLHGGLLGVAFREKDMFGKPATIFSVRPGSPAHKAGIKAGDTIVGVDGRPVDRQAQLRHRLLSRYAGDEITLVVRRGSEKFERPVTLARELPPYQRPMLGLLPMRDPRADGVVVRAVDAGGTAEKAGVKPGDRITSIDAKPVKNRDDVVEQLANKTVGETVPVKIVRGTDSQIVRIDLAAWSASVPEDLAAARKPAADLPADRPATGAIKIAVPELKNDCPAYVPSNYDPRIAYGVVVWPQVAAKMSDANLIDAWKETCEAADLILLAPRSAERDGWRPGELDFVRKALADLADKYTIDPARTVVVAADTSAPIAWRVALALSGKVTAVVALEAPPPGIAIPPADPARSLSTYALRFADSPNVRRLDATLRDLRAKKHSVTVKELPGRSSPLTEAHRDEVVNWIDVLDRL